MKKIKNSLGTLMFFSVVLLMAVQTKACDRSGITLTAITPQPGGRYALEIRFCAGAGNNGSQSGADDNTSIFAFFLSSNANFVGQPSHIVSPQTGYTYEDTLFGGDSLLYFNRNELNDVANEPWACISSTCGPVQTVCYDITLITDGLPDSLWMRGLEAAGNILGGCFGPDMVVYPANGGCSIPLNEIVSHPLCQGSTGSIALSPSGGTAPYTYLWSNGATTSSISGLSPGSYGITVTDATGLCHKSTSIVVNAPIALALNLGANRTVYRGYSPRSCTTLSAVPSSGVGPFTYQWSNGATSSSVNVCPTATTNYFVTVTDACAATITDDVTVNVVDVRCGNNLNKVLLCHNGSTSCVTQSQVATHLNHGDLLGGCTNKAGQPEASLSPEVMELKLTAYPIPATNALHFRVNSPESGTMTLEIFDLKGKRIAIQTGITAEVGGIHELNLDVSQWTAGLYFARLCHSASGSQSLKFTVVD